MTVSTTERRVGYIGDGITDTFTVPFPFSQKDALSVIRTIGSSSTMLVLNADYAVTGEGDPAGGLITLAAPLTGAARLTIKRETPQTQETDYTPNDPFPAESHEQALDKLTLITQELADDLTRAPLVPEDDAQVGSMALPNVDARMGKLFGFDSAGRPSTSLSAADVAQAVALAKAPGAASLAGNVIYAPALTGSVARTLQDRGGDWVSMLDFMTEAQIADIRGRTALIDVSVPMQTAINEAAAAGLSLYGPAGKYRASGLIIPAGHTGRMFMRLDAKADIVPAADGTIILSVSADANRGGPRVIEGGRFDGEGRPGVTGIALGGTTEALLYTRLRDLVVTRCGEAITARNVQEMICDGVVCFANGEGFVAESSITDGGCTVMQWIGCRFQNNQVNFFGKSSSQFPVGGWLFVSCTFQTGFHSGVVVYGQEPGIGRLDNIAMVNCHFEANNQPSVTANRTVRGKTFAPMSLRISGADLSMSAGCELATTRSQFAILENGSRLIIENSRVPSGQVVQFVCDAASRVYLEGRVMMTGSGNGIASWRGFDWLAGTIGGGLVGAPTLVATDTVANQYSSADQFPNAPLAGDQVGATVSNVLNKEHGELRRIVFLASVGSTGANRAIVEALRVPFALGDYGLMTVLVWSDRAASVAFNMTGEDGTGSFGNVTALLRPGWQRVVIYGQAATAEANGYDLFIYPTDAAGATIEITKMMSIKRAVAEGVEDIVNIIRYGWYDDMLSPVFGSGIPTSGTWPKGKVIVNRGAAVGDPQGWRKVTQGSANVLDTNWVALADLAVAP